MPTIFEDEMAVRALAAAYVDAVNRRDADGMAAVLTSDGVIEKPGYGDPVQGREKIRKRYTRLQNSREFLCQMLHSGVVHIDGDRATARWWFSEMKLPSDGGDWLTMIGVYQDEVVRMAEGWRFSRRIQTTIMEQVLRGNGDLAVHALPQFIGIDGLPSL